MRSFKSRCLLDCPYDFRHVSYSRYVDDIFALFFSNDHVDKFKVYLSFKHCKMNFSIEKEKDGSLFF